MRTVLRPGPAERQVFGETLAQLAEQDPRVVVLDGDVGSSTGAALFEAAHPDRYFQMGIAEQNMVGVAAGLATLSYVPFVTTFACFAVARAFDSVRVLIAQNNLNVKIVGGYAGLLTGMTGKTHQIFNDIAMMRTLPNMTVIAPADAIELRQVLSALVATPGPVYLQVTREASPVLLDDSYEFRLGQAVPLREGRDATLVSTGVQTTRAFEATEILASRGLDVGLLHLPTIKPLDATAVLAVADTSKMVVTVEEQSVLGGLGGAVAEVLAGNCRAPLRRLGINDVYGESGPNDWLLDKYRLSGTRLAEQVEHLFDDEPPTC